MIRPFVVVALSLAALAVACGGAVTGVGDGTSSSSGGSSGTSSSSSSSSSSGASSSGSSGGSCTATTEAIDRVCVPGVAIAGLPITVDVDATSCIACDTAVTGCAVDVQGTTITLSMTAQYCPPTAAQGCPDICGLPKETCTIPALAAGTYSVTVAAATQDPSVNTFQSRTLVVAPNGTGASCMLGDPNAQPTLDPTKYSTACTTDNDCVAVSTGTSVCSPCGGGCPNTAIAVADQATYQADLRAASSQCEPGGVSACPACFLPKVTCVKTSGGTGSCQILTD